MARDDEILMSLHRRMHMRGTCDVSYMIWPNWIDTTDLSVILRLVLGADEGKSKATTDTNELTDFQCYHLNMVLILYAHMAKVYKYQKIWYHIKSGWIAARWSEGIDMVSIF